MACDGPIQLDIMLVMGPLLCWGLCNGDNDYVLVCDGSVDRILYRL